MTPEGRVKAKLNRELRKLGASVWRFMPVQTGYGMPALDYLLCVNGRFVAIETKKPGGKTTPRQNATITALETAGAFVFIVSDDASMNDALSTIQDCLNGPPCFKSDGAALTD